MKYRIHGTWPEGTKDYFDVEASNIEALRSIAKQETESRHWKDCWSEPLNEDK